MAETNQIDGDEPLEQNKGYLDDRFDIKMNSVLQELSSDYAKAYDVFDSDSKSGNSNLYALVFESNFPTRLDSIQRLKTIEQDNLQKLVDYGKVILSTAKSEKFAVILQKPVGIKLQEYIATNGPFDSATITNSMSKQLFSAIILLNNHNIVHGSINPNKVYYDPKTSKITVGECISDICGSSQLPAFDAIDQLLCDNECKGNMDLKADYFSAGLLILFMLSGRVPFETLDRDIITKIRLKNSSYESSIVFIRITIAFSISRNMDTLIKGLMTDNRRLRWGENEIKKWHNKEELAAPILRGNRTSLPFEFNDYEYFNTKHLAHDIFLNWTLAKKEIKIFDISRWLSLSIKSTDDAQRLSSIVSKQEEIILPDDKLMKLITLLDPDGPIRYNNFSGHISGIGFSIASSYIENNQKELDSFAKLLESGALEYWTQNQYEDSDFRIKHLKWRPKLIRRFLANKNIGFGIERVLYEMNPGMPCQSPLLQNYYVVTIEELLESLDRYSGDKDDTSPIDRHIGAFIANRINLSDDIKVKSLQNFPHVAKNPEVLMISILSLAQSAGQVAHVKGLTSWINNRLSSLLDSLNSRIIRKNIKNKLQEASEDGNINSLFKIISEPTYARKDLYGFHEARNYYRILSNKISSLQQQSNIQRLAYHLGLRIAVTISYLVCSCTLVYVILQAAS